MHMRFALSLCLRQLAECRLFMFEHPAGANSWGTQMMQARNISYGSHRTYSCKPSDASGTIGNIEKSGHNHKLRCLQFFTQRVQMLHIRKRNHAVKMSRLKRLLTLQEHQLISICV